MGGVRKPDDVAGSDRKGARRSRGNADAKALVAAL